MQPQLHVFICATAMLGQRKHCFLVVVHGLWLLTAIPSSVQTKFSMERGDKDEVLPLAKDLGD